MANEINKVPIFNETISSGYGQFQNVQPLVYDNSISPYETIGKLIWYVKYLISTVNGIIDHLGKVDGDIASLKSDMENVKTRLSEIGEQLLTIVSRLDGHDKDIENINSELENITNDISNIQSMIDNINISISAINESITKLNNDVSDIKGDISTINDELSAVDTHLTAIDEDISSINRNIGSIENQIDTIDSEMGQLTVQVSNNSSAIEDIKQQITTINNTLDSLSNQLTLLTSDVSSISNSLGNTSYSIFVHDSGETDTTIHTFNFIYKGIGKSKLVFLLSKNSDGTWRESDQIGLILVTGNTYVSFIPFMGSPSVDLSANLYCNENAEETGTIEIGFEVEREWVYGQGALMVTPLNGRITFIGGSAPSRFTKKIPFKIDTVNTELTSLDNRMESAEDSIISLQEQINAGVGGGGSNGILLGTCCEKYMSPSYPDYGSTIDCSNISNYRYAYLTVFCYDDNWEQHITFLCYIYHGDYTKFRINGICNFGVDSTLCSLSPGMTDVINPITIKWEIVSKDEIHIVVVDEEMGSHAHYTFNLSDWTPNSFVVKSDDYILSQDNPNTFRYDPDEFLSDYNITAFRGISTLKATGKLWGNYLNYVYRPSTPVSVSDGHLETYITAKTPLNDSLIIVPITILRNISTSPVVYNGTLIIRYNNTGVLGNVFPIYYNSPPVSISYSAEMVGEEEYDVFNPLYNLAIKITLDITPVPSDNYEIAIGYDDLYAWNV